MNEKEEFLKLASFRKCPNCGGELEKGYIFAGEGIVWYTEYHKHWLWRSKERARIVDFPWWKKSEDSQFTLQTLWNINLELRI